MSRRIATEDDWEDENDDDAEYVPDEEDDDSTVPCPNCRGPVYEQSEQCPHCGQYVSEEDRPPSRKPWWIVVGAVLCLFAVYLWVMR